MHKALGVLLVLVMPFLCQVAGAVEGKVVSISSGDIISFQDESGEVRQVRLYGIDAPENEQNMGEHARKMLTAMIGEHDIQVQLAEGGSQDVASAHVALHGLSVNAALVKAGCAWVNRDTCKAPQCATWTGYEEYARNNKKGLWADPSAEPPWKWRARRLKAEEAARKLNAESQYVTYYGSLAESGYHSSWAERTLSGSLPSGGNTLSSVTAGSSSTRRPATRSGGSAIGAKTGKTFKAGSSGGGPRPGARRG